MKYPDPFDFFYLPVDKIDFYDDPYEGGGDDGYTVKSLKAAVIHDGKINEPISVGKSRHELKKNVSTIFAFNGNHRLAVAKELNFNMILCMNSGVDDAFPLTIEEISNLGGKME